MGLLCCLAWPFAVFGLVAEQRVGSFLAVFGLVCLAVHQKRPGRTSGRVGRVSPLDLGRVSLGQNLSCGGLSEPVCFNHFFNELSLRKI